MRIVKRHAAIPILVLVMILITVLAVSIYRMKDHANFYILDLIGKREAIQDIVINGELGDGYHRTSFLIAQGQLQTKTQFYNQPRAINPYPHYIAGNPARINGMDYTIHGNRIFEIYARQWLDYYSYPTGRAVVNPGLQVQGMHSFEYSNPLEYGLAGIGNNIYYTVPVSKGYTGESGIYELKFGEWYAQTQELEKAYKARHLADISLEANQAGLERNNGEGIEVLGLEAVGNELALVFVENNQLTIRGFNSENGRVLGEVRVPGFYLAGQRTEVGGEDAETHNATYEAHSSSSLQMLNLSFKRSTSTEGQLAYTVLSIDFSNGVTLVDKSLLSFDGVEEDTLRGKISYLSYQGGRLYVIKTFVEQEHAETHYSSDVTRPLQFLISVYEQSELVYRGELITDLNEDNIKLQHSLTQQGQYPYDPMDYRTFKNVSIE